MNLNAAHFTIERKAIVERFRSWTVDGDVSLTVYDSGFAPGPVALLINAYGMPFDAIRPLALELVRRGYRAITWDCRVLPGDGRPFVDVCGVTAHCTDAATVLNACGVEHVDLAVGWCTGARILLHLAARGTPTMGRGLLLNGAYVFGGVPLTTFQSQLHELLARLAEDQRMASVLCAALQRGVQRGQRFSSDPELGRIVAHPFKDADRLVRYAALFHDVVADQDDLTLAANVTFPLIVVSGLQDEVTSPEASRLVATATPLATYVELSDGSHYVPYTHADQLPL